jgi:hypothetical protein
MAKAPAKSAKPPSTLEALSPQQRRYVDARVCGMNPSAAAKAAGLPASNGPGLERSPTVQLAIKEINEKAMNDLVLSRQDVINGMMDAVKAAASSTELVAAWREIGKIIGAYEPQKIAVTHEMLLPEQLRVMSDRQLIVAAGMEGVTLDGEYEEVLATLTS